MNTQNYIKVIPNFPSEGVFFRHVGPLLNNKNAFKNAINDILATVDDNLLKQVDVVAGLDARGFIFSTALQLLSSNDYGNVMIRKKSKTPGDVYSTEYDLEYGSSAFELEKGLIAEGSKVLIVDDVLATGGSMLAAANLVKQAGGIPLIFCTLIELDGLNGRQKINKVYPDVHVHSHLVYPHDSSTLTPINAKPQIETVSYKSNNTKTNSNTVLMFHHTLESMAKRMRVQCDYKLSFVDWSYFPDTWPNITFDSKDNLINKDVVFLFSAARKEIFLEQMSLLIALPRQLIKSLTVVIPYLGPATHERVDYDGMLATVEPLLKLISTSIPMTRSGPPRIFDIHALQERFYTSDNIIMELMTAIPLLKDYLKEKYQHIESYPAIAFPDDGAYKRFKYMFGDGYKMVVCSKVRSADGGRSVKIKDMYGWGPNPTYDNILIVDDLVQSGGTLIECSNALKTFGFKNVSAYVTHAVFPNNTWKRITPAIFDEFIVTNTNPEVTDMLGSVKPFKVLNVETCLINEINKYLGKSIVSGNKVHDHKVYVTSTNKDKLAAVYEYFNDEIGLCTEVIGVKTSSSIPEQPYGEHQTKLGAKNRLTDIMSKIDMNQENLYIFSIESGIEATLLEYYDFTAVSIYKGNNSDFAFIENTYTNSKLIPRKYRDLAYKSIREHKQMITFGSLMSEKFDISDWHKYVTGESRKDIIKRVLCTMNEGLFSNSS